MNDLDYLLTVMDLVIFERLSDVSRRAAYYDRVEMYNGTNGADRHSAKIMRHYLRAESQD